MILHKAPGLAALPFTTANSFCHHIDGVFLDYQKKSTTLDELQHHIKLLIVDLVNAIEERVD